mgnify:CR=1 FL=1
MLKKNFCTYAVIYAICVITLKIILNLFNLEFMTWIYYASAAYVFLMIVIGIFQLLLQIKKKVLKVIIIIIFLIILYYIGIFGKFIFVFGYRPEVMREKDGIKVVEFQKYWNRNEEIDYYYYKYYNLFLRSKECISVDTVVFD